MYTQPVLRWLVVVCLVLPLAGPALAGMSLDRNIIHFAPGQPERIDVSVRNSGNEPLYVDTEVFEVEGAGSSDERLVPVLQGPEMALLVSPNKLVVPPGRAKLLRIVNLAGHSEQERVFRINAKPVAPPATAERSGIRLFVGYQMLVFLEPAAPRPDLESHRVPGQVTFENRGNTNVLLHSGLQCPPGIDPAAERDSCVTLQGTRLYPGSSWSMKVAWETPVEFTVTTGERNSRQQF